VSRGIRFGAVFYSKEWKQKERQWAYRDEREGKKKCEGLWGRTRKFT